MFVSNIRNGSISFDTNKFVSNEEFQKLTKHNLIEAGDVLYTAVGSYGNSAVVPRGKTFVFQRHIAHIKPNRHLLDANYLSRVLETPSVRKQADRVARGVAQKTVTLSSLRNFQIHLPPLAEQRRIAAILDKADELRRKRKRALDLIQDLIESSFIQMFGDERSSRFEVKRLDAVTDQITDGAHFTPTYVEKGVPFLRVTDLQNKTID